MIDMKKRTSFEEAAEVYDEIASGYPDELIEDIVSLSGIAPGGRILEIGCGPGNATEPFAKRGYSILGIEIGKRLAEFAAARCRSYLKVSIVNLAFEDWPLEKDAFDMALAADSFHWIPSDVGYPKVAAALKGTGSLDFFWNVPVDPKTDWSEEIDSVYQEIAPRFVNPDKRFTAEWLIETITRHITASGCFGELETKQYTWSTSLTGEQYIKGLSLFSMHKDMDDKTRQLLYARILNIIDRYGGKIDQPVSVMLFHARVKK